MAMLAEPRETCWLCVSLLVPKENLLVLCNEFGFAMLNPISVGSKRFVWVLSWFDAFCSSVHMILN